MKITRENIFKMSSTMPYNRRPEQIIKKISFDVIDIKSYAQSLLRRKTERVYSTFMAVFSIKWFYLKGTHLLGQQNTFAGKDPASQFSAPVTQTSRLARRPFFLLHPASHTPITGPRGPWQFCDSRPPQLWPICNHRIQLFHSLLIVVNIY